MLTGEYLFKPSNKSYKGVSEDECHLGLMIATLGEIPKSVATAGNWFEKFFTKSGKFRKKAAMNLNTFGIAEILMNEFSFETKEADEIETFLLPMLKYEQD